MHVLESAEERDWMLGRSPWLAKVLTSRGLPSAANRTTRGAIGWLREAGLFSTAPLLAHANYLDSADLDVLAAGHASVAWCPRAHAFFGHAAHPWQEMLAAGVNVCIATDSLASNASLSLLDELRWVYGHHPEVSPALLVAMATLHGARALRLDHLIGSLQPGRRADFVTIPMDPAASPTPLENLVSGRSRVRSVFVDGLCVATTTETG
jgi:cytosine/adenosine deaminase-related metal-dependent hydrolase